MPITVATAALHAAMSATAQAVAGRMPEQRLAHLTARDGTLTVHAGDALATSATATVDADVPHGHPTDTTYVPHSFLAELADHIRKMSDTVTLDLTDTAPDTNARAAGIHLAAQGASGTHAFTARINRELPPSSPQAADATPAFTLNTTRDILEALLEPEYAVSRQPWDTTLGGLYIDGSDGHLTLVGSDGSRLALAGIGLPDQDASGIAGRALTRASAAAIRRALAFAGRDTVRVSVNAARSHLTAAATGASPRVTITVALREATSFPKYQRVLPGADARVTVRVHRETLLAAVNRLKPLSLAGANAISITAPERVPELRLEVASVNGEPASERLPLAMALAEEARVRVNAAYLADALAHYRSEYVEWQLGAVTALRGGSEDGGRLDVIAQVRGA